MEVTCEIAQPIQPIFTQLSGNFQTATRIFFVLCFNFHLKAGKNHKFSILVEHIGSEINYVLPVQDRTGQNLIKDFETFFRALDKKMANLQIKSYGLSDTTLEEIFLKVASNIHDGEIVREIQYEDITDHGRLVDHLFFSSQTHKR